MGDLSRFEWLTGHENRITFVMIDGSGNEVAGIGAGLTIQIAKNGGSFSAAAGVQTEMGLGWYSYLATVAESDTFGPVSIVSNGAGAIQQNLEYVVANRVQNTRSYTYPLTGPGPSFTPITDARVEIYTDVTKLNRIWYGTTDDFGHARDGFDALPILQIGQTYYIWNAKVGFTFDNPDIETIAAI